MKYSIYFYFRHLILLICSFFIATNTAMAATLEQSTAKDAFMSINKALYAIEETKNYCNANFSSDISRNNEAFEQWELQYNFFLREFDKNYEKWKSGFSQLEQQQFSTLEYIQRKKAQQEIQNEYREGGADKCYNFKPALMRPRNNLELTYQDDFNLIRNQSMSSFNAGRNEGTGSNSLCAWQQENALKVGTLRDEGKDIKFQKNQLKAFKKLSPDNIDKNEHAARVKSYSDMINDIYASGLKSLSFSQYQFAACERENHGVESISLKKALPLIIECQNKSVDYSDLLGNCINQALDEK